MVVDKVKYSVCKACGKQIKYFGGTTNMKLHARQHEEKPDGGKSSSSKNAAGATLDGFVVRRSNPQRVCPVWKTNGANELVVRWLWRNLRPLDIVNDEGLQDLLRFFEPGYNLPSRTFVAAQLKMKYAAARDKLKEVLRVEAEAGLSLTSDIWTSRATEAYNTITCHLIDSEWNMKVYVLGTTAFPGHHTGVWIAELLEKTTGDLGIPVSQVYAHVHDKAANAELA